ncbi:MAG: glutathione S-transferase family protein [Pseudomonadota bacterium]
MRTLLHASFDPPSRALRLVMAEKSLTFQGVALDLSAMDDSERETLAAANPAMTLPVLIDQAPSGETASIAPLIAAIDYLEEAYPEPIIYPKTAAGRAEMRRLILWFADKFAREVSAPLLTRGDLAGERRREAFSALRWHLDYFEWLLERRACLACDRISAADLVAAAFLSTHDYFGDVPWADFPETQGWHRRMKSRPAMRAILDDRSPHAPPRPGYADPDA